MNWAMSALEVRVTIFGRESAGEDLHTHLEMHAATMARRSLPCGRVCCVVTFLSVQGQALMFSGAGHLLTYSACTTTT